MAATFGANLQAAASVAADLSSIRSELSGIAASIGDAGAATGSAKVASALEGFVKHSSDDRKKLDEMLKGAAGLLQSLVDGARSVDTALTDALSQPDPAPVGGRR
jgi:hypothetical protein